MPFDPFFSSANKKHYIPVEGSNELYDKVAAMSFEERQELIHQWKQRRMTPAEYAVFKKLKFNLQGRRWARVHNDLEKRVEIATEEFKQGKRVLRVETNARQFNTTSGAVTPLQKRTSRR